MAELNPFYDDLNEENVNKAVEFDEVTLGSSEKDDESSDSSLDAIASQLLKDNLILTALELHTELVEARKELPRLRDFFSNPANFERTKLTPDLPFSGLPRTSSIQTFDSLDFAKYSDDGDRQEIEKVAVLEFELRKAHETIKSLRASLTKTADTVPTPVTDQSQVQESGGDEIKPHETRALNFLVNEYLLISNYKLTSVTFAEENENQDFEDWDDVGLNLAKPPDLLHLYRDYGQHQQTGDSSCSVGVMVDMDAELGVNDKVLELDQLNEDLKEQMRNLESQIETLKNENAFLANQVKQFERISDASAIKSSTPVVSPINTPSQTPSKTGALPVTSNEPGAKFNDQAVSNGTDLDARSLGDGAAAEELAISCVPQANQNLAPNSQEMQDDAIANNADEVDNEVTDAADDSVENETDTNRIPTDVVLNNDQIQTDNISDVVENLEQTSDVKDPETVQERLLPKPFQEALLSLAFHASPDNRIVCEVRRIEGATPERVVGMLGRCLSNIVPNVILAKREELIPVILMTATLHPDTKQRDELLNILFNLIKKPDLQQRQMILTGCVAFAQCVGAGRVETELLPQCWEQIAHKYWERRLLVAEACGALAAHLPPHIRSSLVLSMLHQMLEDEKSDEVRVAIVKSLGILYGFVSDEEKYIQGGRLLMKALVDTSEGVCKAAMDVFLPTFAMWTLQMQKLELDLYPSFLRKLIELVNVSRESNAPNSLDQSRFTLYVQCMHRILPFLYVMILQSAPFAEEVSQKCANKATDIASQVVATSGGCDALREAAVICGSAHVLEALAQRYEACISEEWYEPWDSFAWVAGEFMPEMINLLNSLESGLSAVVHALAHFFRALCRLFGSTFTKTQVKQKFQKVLIIPEDHKVSGQQVALVRCTAAVYAAGVLAAFSQEENSKALEEYLTDLMICLSVSDLPIASFTAAFQELCEEPSWHELLLRVLWAGVVHSAANVRATAASAFLLLARSCDGELVSGRVLPALVTLASDPQMPVRVATVPALGTLIETATDRAILAKVHMQLEMFTEPGYEQEHAMHVQMISTLARVGPNAEPWFRDEFVLPRLARYASHNNHVTNESFKREVALQLFEAYSALSCCFIPAEQVRGVLLPGLQALLHDVTQVAPDHVRVLESMMREFDEKLQTAQLQDKWREQEASTTGQHDPSRSNMFSRFKDVTSRFGHKK